MEPTQEQIIFRQYHNFRFLLRHYPVEQLMAFTGLSNSMILRDIKTTKQREKVDLDRKRALRIDKLKEV